MGLFERGHFAKEDDEAGVFLGDFSRALVTWVAMQDRLNVTVREAAQTFNTTDAVIREAVDEAHWIFVSGPDDDPTKQILELDGA